MNTLLFVKGLIGLLVFLAAGGAALTQLQNRKLIGPLLPLQGPALLAWHRRLGRIALAGFVLNSVICLELGFYPALRTDPRHVIHSILGVLLAIAFFGKVWVTRRKLRWGLRRIVIWGGVVFVLHAGVFASATIFALWARLAGVA